MRLAQQEIRSTVSVNMFELSTRKKDEDSDVSSIRSKKGTVTQWRILSKPFLNINCSQHNIELSPECGQKSFATPAVWNVQQTTVSPQRWI